MKSMAQTLVQSDKLKVTSQHAFQITFYFLYVYFLGSHAVLTQLCVKFCILPQRPQYQVAEVY